MASLAELAAQGPYQWYQTEGGSQAYGIPGQQPIAEFLPATNEVYWYRGGQVPQEILARFPGARVRDVTTDPAFEYGRTDDFAGNLGDYMPYLAAAGVGGGMIAPWAAGGAGAGAASGAALEPAVAAEAAGGGNITGMGLADPWGAGSVSGTGALAEAPTTLSGMAGNVVDAVAPAAGAGSWGTGLVSSAGDLPKTPTQDLTSLQALKNILANGGTVDDWLKTAGAVGPALLGAYASNQQANSLADLASKYEGYGAPSRARYEGSFAPGFTMESDPGYKDALDQSAKATLHAMSAKFGNPAGSPNAWTQTLQDLYKGTAYPALLNYRNQNAATSGIGTFSSAVPEITTGSMAAGSNVWNALGKGASDIFNPTPQKMTLADLVRMSQELRA